MTKSERRLLGRPRTEAEKRREAKYNAARARIKAELKAQSRKR